jgi:RimJ/RimL family protein N-acetyltransferase
VEPRSDERLRETAVRLRLGPVSEPPRTDVLVRDVRWDDFSDLRDVYFHLYDERDRGEPIGITLFAERPSLADEVDWFTRAYRNVLQGIQVMSVAEVEGHVVGSCSVSRKGPPVASETGHVGILGILIDAPHRRRGIGEALMRHAIDRCRGKFELIYLTVFSINDRAQRLYRKLGFVPVGHQPRVVRRGDRYYDEEEMILDLGSPPSAPAKR